MWFGKGSTPMKTLNWFVSVDPLPTHIPCDGLQVHGWKGSVWWGGWNRPCNADTLHLQALSEATWVSSHSLQRNLCGYIGVFFISPLSSFSSSQPSPLHSSLVCVLFWCSEVWLEMGAAHTPRIRTLLHHNTHWALIHHSNFTDFNSR